MAVRKIPPKDYFGNIIEVGDAYFYGNPPNAGKVTKVHPGMRGGWIELTYDCDVWNEKLDRYVPGKATMKCGSPADGVCLDKTYDKKIVDNWII